MQQHNKTNDRIIYAALGLAATLALLSGLYHAENAQQKFLWLLDTIATSEMFAIVGAIGEHVSFPVSP